MKKIAGLSLIIIFLSSFAFAGTVNLPKTGQTKCYDIAGWEISCVGTGQDGEIQAGVEWPSPRFTVSSEVVTDNLTGLMWTKNGNLNNGGWNQAIDYCSNLTLGGYTDWRLPNVKELESLVNANEGYLPTWLTAQGFTNVQADYYWSSTTVAYSPGYAWFISMWYGYVQGDAKSPYPTVYVWPVRGGQIQSSGCSAWADVVAKYQAYKNGQATFGDVIDCFREWRENRTQE